MIGAILGDIAGSTYEFMSNRDPMVELFPQGSDFTDDSILTVATCDVLLAAEGGQQTAGAFRCAYREYGARFPHPMGGYGVRFAEWLRLPDSEAAPYGSFGNGAAMRVTPVGLACATIEEVLAVAEASAAVSHDHPEAIKGAQAAALAVFLGKTGSSKDAIRSEITSRFGYDLSRTVEEIRPDYRFDETCQGTVPEAIIAFLDSTDFESALRNAISLGGDADTIGCITGGIAHAFYKDIPQTFIDHARKLLPKEFVEIVDRFHQRFGL
jgi:ADP-ribosyl-[dinitrogen reductase] hydrolase